MIKISGPYGPYPEKKKLLQKMWVAPIRLQQKKTGGLSVSKQPTDTAQKQKQHLKYINAASSYR